MWHGMNYVEFTNIILIYLETLFTILTLFITILDFIILFAWNLNSRLRSTQPVPKIKTYIGLLKSENTIPVTEKPGFKSRLWNCIIFIEALSKHLMYCSLHGRSIDSVILCVEPELNQFYRKTDFISSHSMNTWNLN